MVFKITRGVKVTVNVYFVGKRMQDNSLVNYFNYEISIENTTNDKVQLIQRYWLIKDVLNNYEEVQGEGVVGVKPVLQTNESFTYTSGCLIHGDLGSMQGYFTFLNLETSSLFHVKIPFFKLIIPSIKN